MGIPKVLLLVNLMILKAMVRLIHSYSSRPLCVRRYDLGFEQLAGIVWYYSLSVAYAKRIGAEIVLHTDTLGKALLGHLPYDEIHLTLDDIPEWVHPRFWAAGKFFAIEREPLGAIHIDGDVFIKRAELLSSICDCDIVVQNYETADWYDKERIFFRSVPESLLLRHGLDIDHTGGYCTGLFGIFNAEYKRRYLDCYFDVVRAASLSATNKLNMASWATPDLITEQQWALQLACNMGASVKLLLDEPDLTAQAVRIGYQHVMTASKYSLLSKVKQTLHKIAPDIYLKTELLCRNI